MRTITRYNVSSFCARHGVVLDTLNDWRPLDPNYTFTHRFFGLVFDGITDGIVAWTVHADTVHFVHLDMCEVERKPSERVAQTRPSPRPKAKDIPQRPRLTITDVLSNLVSADMY